MGLFLQTLYFCLLLGQCNLFFRPKLKYDLCILSEINLYVYIFLLPYTIWYLFDYYCNIIVIFIRVSKFLFFIITHTVPAKYYYFLVKKFFWILDLTYTGIIVEFYVLHFVYFLYLFRY